MNKFAKRVLSAMVSLMMVLTLVPCTVWADAVASEEEIVIPGVMSAADILAASDEAPAEEIVTESDADLTAAEAAIFEEYLAAAEQKKAEAAAILEKYLGAAELSAEEVAAIVETMSFDDMDAAYAEMEAYALNLNEYELANVSATMVSFAEAIEAVMAPALFAKTVTVGMVDITDTVGNGSLSNGVVTIKASGSLFSKKTNTITVSNASDSKAQVSFAYTASTYNSFTVAGVAASATGTWSGVLDINEGVVLVLTSNSGLSNTTATLTISNVVFEKFQDESTVVFDYNAEFGSVTVDGAAVSSGDSRTINNATGATITATPKSGCSFMAWVNASTGAVISENATDVFVPGVNMTIKPIFINPNSNAVFGVAGCLFDDLSAAVTVAQNGTSKVVYLAANGTLPAGDYTIPAGITLLIPFDANNTLYTTKPRAVSSTASALGTIFGGDSYDEGNYTKPTVYRKLTMANGANLTINGAISLSNKIFSGNAGMRAGSPTGPVSMIQMASGSNINVNNGATAYVYGYIYGDGIVNVKSGASVYECMQVLDFRGGDATTQMPDNEYGVFPFSQYYVQNIEALTKYEGGAKEYVVSSLTMSQACFTTAVPFIGDSNCMFVPATGAKFSKRFDPATGRLTVEADGNMSLSPLTVSVSTTKINTEKMVLPIASSITIRINSGTAMVNQDLALLPGVELYVGKDAVLTVPKGHEAFAYDLDSWKDKKYFYKRNTEFADNDHAWLTYTATTTSTKQVLKDAKIDINGEINGEGCLYTTEGGAQIISSEGTGVVKVPVNANYATATYQAYQYTDSNSNQVLDYQPIPVTSVVLTNADGSYTETAASQSTGEFRYTDGIWTEKLIGIYFNANGGDGAMAAQYSDFVTAITLNENTFTRSGYTFLGWSLTPDGDVAFSDKGIVGVVEEDITLYAVWEKACEHKNTEPAVPAEDANCSTPGTTAGLKCSDCQEILEEPVEIPVNDKHSFTDYVSDGNATVTEDGTKTATCDHGCGATDTVIDIGSRTGLKNINLTNSGMTFTAIVEGYQGSATLYVGVYDAYGKLLAINTVAVTNDTAATVTVASVSGAAYAKAFAWNGFTPVAMAKQIGLN